MKHELKLEEWTALQELIDNSIIERYDGDLERSGPGHHGEIYYWPLDTDHIRTLLVELWGELLTAETIEDFFKRLTKNGAEEWPHAYCEDDEAERPLSSYYTEEDEAADWFDAVVRGEAAAQG